MKRFIVFFAALALCAAPAFAGPGMKTNDAKVQSYATQSSFLGAVKDGVSAVREVKTLFDTDNSINATVNTITNSKVTASQGGTVDVGNINGKNAKVNASVNTLTNTEVTATGEGARVGIGTIDNGGGLVNASVNTITGGSITATDKNSSVNIGGIGSK